jgi:hypothetical protein
MGPDLAKIFIPANGGHYHLTMATTKPFLRNSCFMLVYGLKECSASINSCLMKDNQGNSKELVMLLKEMAITAFAPIEPDFSHHTTQYNIPQGDIGGVISMRANTPGISPNLWEQNCTLLDAEFAMVPASQLAN